MNGIEILAQTYNSVWITLVKWIEPYVGVSDAKKIVRATLAEMFRLACSAFNTVNGPYADAADAVLARVIQHGFIDPMTSTPWPMRTLGIPDDNALCEIARLYAVTYHAQYSMSWTLAERDEIYIWLRTTDCPVYGLPTDTIVTVEYDLAPHPLRRAVEYLSNNPCGEELICQVAQEIWSLEETKGRDWQRAHNPVEANAPWRASER